MHFLSVQLKSELLEVPFGTKPNALNITWVPESLIDMCIFREEPDEIHLKPLFIDLQNVQYLQNLGINPILT